MMNLIEETTDFLLTEAEIVHILLEEDSNDTDEDILLLDDGTTNTPNSSTEGKPFFESGASYATTSFDDKEISTDSYANNVGIETVADSILDFTEGNPFSEGTGY